MIEKSTFVRDSVTFFKENKMENIQQKLADLKLEMEKIRDEAKLQAHLGKAEMASELEALEKEWDALTLKAKPFTDEAEKTLENTGEALELAANELVEGFNRIRKLF